MTVGVVPTQGTKLYFIDNATTSQAEVLKMACPTGITGIGGGAKDQVETTCLDTLQDKEYRGGLGNPSAISVPFNLIPREFSHQRLFELKRLGSVLHWLNVLADNENDPGNEAFVTPTVNGSGAFDPTTDRSSFMFDGYVSEVNIDEATNDIVRGTLTIQRSGAEVFTAYIPA